MLFQRQDWTVLRTLDGLCRKAGAPQHKLASVVIKELVDNALDVAGDCELTFADGVATIRDGGPGIDGDDELIAGLFSLSRPLTSSKYLRLPTRGALGNGLRCVASAVGLTKGELRVTTGGRTLAIIPDLLSGRSTAERIGDSPDPGTRVEVRLGDPLRIGEADLDLANLGIAATRAQRDCYAGKSSPHWYGPDDLYELLLSIPPDDPATVREFLTRFDGCSAKKIADGFSARPARSLNRDEARQLLERARAAAREVAPKRLGSLGESAFPAAYAKAAGFASLGAGQGDIRLPAVVEAWAEPQAWYPLPEAIFLVNGSGCIDNPRAWYQRRERITAIHGLGLDLRVKTGRAMIILHVNITTPYMPVTSEGKQPELGAFKDLLGMAIGKAAGRAKKLPGAVAWPGPRAAASRPVAPAAPRLSIRDVVFAHMEEQIQEVSPGRRYRFHWRQVFYRMRPIVRRALDRDDEEEKELKWKYFDGLVTEYEKDHGEEPMAYRDPRGTFYVPHGGRDGSFPLGTIEVEEFRRPAWRFDKVLFIEKEGFFEALKAEGWPERHDCALMTSKGQPTRAARDIIDLIGETDEPVTVFCLHDCDAAGTLIYQSLQEETRARPRRNVEIVNLGLDPPEAMALAERGEVEIEDHSHPMEPARYIKKHRRWAEWLQAHRVELNAFTTPQFIEWLDGKMAAHAGKVIPPPEVMTRRLEQHLDEMLRERIVARVLERADVDGLVDRAKERRAGAIASASARIVDTVSAALGRQRRRAWTDPVRSLARRIAGRGGSAKRP
jgi:hypothetical protein